MSIKTTMELVDNVSAKFDKMAQSGNRAFSAIQTGSTGAATAYERLSSYCSKGDLDLLSRSAKQAGVDLTQARDATLQWADGIDALEQSALEFTYTDEELVAMGKKVKSNFDETASAADEVAEEYDEVAEEAEKAGEKSENFGEKSKSSMEDLQGILASAGIVAGLKQIADGFKECSDQAEVYETAIAKLQTISGNSMINELNGDIMTLSNNTGAAAENLADVAYNAISAGTAVEESVMTAGTASKLATAGFTDETSALSVLETAMNSYGDKAGSVTDISDSLIQVQNLGVTTVAQLASQMGRAISTASAYDVSLGNVETAYIATTKAGIATAESTTYISGMLNELGKDGSDVSKILSNETNMSFGQLMASGQSLGDVLGVIYDSTNQNAEAFMNLWSSQEAGKAAMAIVNQGLDSFNENLNKVENSAGATDKAYQIMANTTEYAHNRMTNSAKNLETVIGGKLNNSLKVLYNNSANILTKVSDFVDKNPAVVGAVTGVSIAIGVLAGGIATYTAVTKIATLAQAAFTAVLDTNPIFLAITAVAALAAGYVALTTVMNGCVDEYDTLTVSSQENYNELQKATDAYNEAVNKYGENSEQATKLADDVDVLTAKYQSNKETLEEWNAEVESVVSAQKDLHEQVGEITKDYDTGEISVSNLANRLEELTSKTNLSSAEQSEASAIVDVLNGKMEGLNLTFDDSTNKVNMSTAAIEGYYKAIAKPSVVDKAKEKIGELSDTGANLQLDKAKADKQLKAAQAAYDNAMKQYNDYIAQNTSVEIPFASLGAAIGGKNLYDIDRLEDELEQAKANVDSIDESIKQNEADIQDLNDVIADNTANTDIAGETAEEVIQSAQGNIEMLAQAYDSAYASAKESFEGQFTLFDQAKADTEATVANAQKALDSQLEFWTSYASNVETLKGISASDLGTTKKTYDEIMAYAQSGTEQAAGFAKSLADAVNSGNTQAVEKLMSTYSQVKAQQEKAAGEVADFKTHFSEQLDDVEQRMVTAVKNMDQSAAATTSATNTINAYVASIRAGVNQAYNAAAAVANATTRGLSSGSTPSIPHHAKGTTNAEDVFIAGEEGPELIVGKQGASVFPNEETNRIIDAIGSNYDSEQVAPKYDAPDNSGSAINSVQTINNNSTSEKKVTLEINGKGAIQGFSSMSRDDVVDIIYEEVKDALVSIVVSEMAEEGEKAYEY